MQEVYEIALQSLKFLFLSIMIATPSESCAQDRGRGAYDTTGVKRPGAPPPPPK